MYPRCNFPGYAGFGFSGGETLCHGIKLYLQCRLPESFSRLRLPRTPLPRFPSAPGPPPRPNNYSESRVAVTAGGCRAALGGDGASPVSTRAGYSNTESALITRGSNLAGRSRAFPSRRCSSVEPLPSRRASKLRRYARTHRSRCSRSGNRFSRFIGGNGRRSMP